jgi:general secretion pathway protein I
MQALYIVHCPRRSWRRRGRGEPGVAPAGAAQAEHHRLPHLTRPLRPIGAERGDIAGAAGFTLIEIIIAFAVAVLLLGALYQVFATGLRAGSAAENLSDAVLLAQSALDATAGVAVVAGETSDRIGDYERRTVIRPRPDLGTGGGSGVMPYEIAVTVEWPARGGKRSVELRTLRLGAAP